MFPGPLFALSAQAAASSVAVIQALHAPTRIATLVLSGGAVDCPWPGVYTPRRQVAKQDIPTPLGG